VIITEALREAAARLAATSDTARLDAEVLMAHALGVTRSDLLLRQMADPAPAAFSALIERRLGHEPVAYIVGETEFFGRPFLVSPAVLIPRGDSEVLVEAALEAAPEVRRVLDCGTGSGALLLSVLAARPAAAGIGTDRSLDALQVAAANAARLGLADRARFLAADWDEPDWAKGLGTFDLILANPPYVETGAELSPSVRKHEPAEALFAGEDGLDDYRTLIPQLPALLAERGIAVLEIGATQADAVIEIAKLTGFSAQLHKDLAARPRALVLRLGLGKSESAG
jgi:release factor glutamine methyltransferase